MSYAVSMGRRAIAEAIGTSLLVVAGPGAAAVDAARNGAITHVGVSLAFAAIITIVVATFASVSGAHINPAVTVALWARGRFPLREVPLYVVAQCIGAVLGSVGIAAILGRAVAAGVTTPSVTVGAALGLEIGMSALLMAVILGVIGTAPSDLGGAAAIGVAVGVCALVGGPLTGASLNPARSFGPALISGQWTAHWIYWIGPVAGMLLAARGDAWLRSEKPIRPSSDA